MRVEAMAMTATSTAAVSASIAGARAGASRAVRIAGAVTARTMAGKAGELALM
jgi:hypothetical protein